MPQNNTLTFYTYSVELTLSFRSTPRCESCWSFLLASKDMLVIQEREHGSVNAVYIGYHEHRFPESFAPERVVTWAHSSSGGPQIGHVREKSLRLGAFLCGW